MTVAPPARRRRRPVSELEFVGCEPRRMTLAEYEAHEGRVEFYDSASGVAWMVCEPAGPYHEKPREWLSRLLHVVSQARGSRITSLGESQLRLLEAESRMFDSMHPDQLVFLDPDFRTPPDFTFLTPGEGPYPEVVVEVDHTTDVRRSRLARYEEWRFPEVWVEVPDADSPSRPRGLKPGLTIHLLEKGRYVRSPASRAFPGWLATEIHRGINERPESEETKDTAYRVGRALGKREGTVPEDDASIRRFLHQGRAEGHAEGRAEGLAEGRVELAGLLLRQGGVALPSRSPTSCPPRTGRPWDASPPTPSSGPPRRPPRSPTSSPGCGSRPPERQRPAVKRPGSDTRPANHDPAGGQPAPAPR